MLLTPQRDSIEVKRSVTTALYCFGKTTFGIMCTACHHDTKKGLRPRKSVERLKHDEQLQKLAMSR